MLSSLTGDEDIAMTIRLATEADIPLILARVSELPYPPNMNEDGVRELLKYDVVMVDDVLKAVCSWHRNDRFEMIFGRYLLGPAGVTLVQKMPLQAWTFDAILKRWPDVADWRIEGTFPNEADSGVAMARFWERKLTKAGEPGPHATVSEISGRPCIWWTVGQVRDRAMEWVS